MRINIYYGGRGLIDDPTLYVMNKMQEILEELNVKVERYNLYDLRNNIATLPQTLKGTDGVILAATVEWYGIGGYMQQFLDSCWLYGDKELISKIYMCPVVMSTTYGEREAKLNLSTAWEILGGRPCSGICGYIADTVSMEMNKEYTNIFEKKAENMYRTINQKLACLPASNQAVKQTVAIKNNIDLTPQESEQLSQYTSNDEYVQKQKEDIQELTSFFKDMLESKDSDEGGMFVRDFKSHFKPQPGVTASYRIVFKEKSQALIIKVHNLDLECSYGTIENPDVEIQMSTETMNEIVYGRVTFQGTFMGGNMKMKGDFKVLRALDQIFTFMDSKI